MPWLYCLQTGPRESGNDTRYMDEKVKAARNFANKIWNATRFIQMNLSDEITKIELPWITDTITILGASTKRVTVITPILTLMLVVGLVVLIKRTKVGMAMRAASKDFETAQLMGIRINSVISFTFIIGSALAAVASFLYFSNYTTIAPASGAMPGLKAFVAAVFGGIGSIPGAVIGAFIIGICENLLKGMKLTAFSDAFTFALLIVILVVKPTGLFGEKLTEDCCMACTAVAPHVGATGIAQGSRQAACVSIHAPTWGATTCLWSLASIRVL